MSSETVSSDLWSGYTGPEYLESVRPRQLGHTLPGEQATFRVTETELYSPIGAGRQVSFKIDSYSSLPAPGYTPTAKRMIYYISSLASPKDHPMARFMGGLLSSLSSPALETEVVIIEATGMPTFEEQQKIDAEQEVQVDEFSPKYIPLNVLDAMDYTLSKPKPDAANNEQTNEEEEVVVIGASVGGNRLAKILYEALYGSRREQFEGRLGTNVKMIDIEGPVNWRLMSESGRSYLTKKVNRRKKEHPDLGYTNAMSGVRREPRQVWLDPDTIHTLEAFDMLPELRRLYAKLKIPTLLLSGEEDTWVRPGSMHQILGFLATAGIATDHIRHLILPKTPHVPPTGTGLRLIGETVAGYIFRPEEPELWTPSGAKLTIGTPWPNEQRKEANPE